MKRIFIALLAVSAFLGMASASFAVKDTAGMVRQDEALVVKNVKGENIGTIRGALEDPQGDIAFVIVSLKDESAGEKDVVVPVQAFSPGNENGTFVLDMSNDVLVSAPEFNASKLDDPAYASDLYTFYGQTPPWN